MVTAPSFLAPSTSRLVRSGPSYMASSASVGGRCCAAAGMATRHVSMTESAHWQTDGIARQGSSLDISVLPNDLRQFNRSSLKHDPAPIALQDDKMLCVKAGKFILSSRPSEARAGTQLSKHASVASWVPDQPFGLSRMTM